MHCIPAHVCQEADCHLLVQRIMIGFFIIFNLCFRAIRLTFARTESLVTSINVLRKETPGFLGGYHFKMFLDFLVACNWVPPKWVSEYPVCIKGGTAKALNQIYPGHGHGAVQYSHMLNELTHRVMTCCHSWCPSDHQGSVGAALCWWIRLSENSSSAAHENRFEETGVVT